MIRKKIIHPIGSLVLSMLLLSPGAWARRSGSSLNAINLAEAIPEKVFADADKDYSPTMDMESSLQINTAGVNSSEPTMIATGRKRGKTKKARQPSSRQKKNKTTLKSSKQKEKGKKTKRKTKKGRQGEVSL